MSAAIPPIWYIIGPENLEKVLKLSENILKFQIFVH